MTPITRTIKQALAQAKASNHPSDQALIDFDKAGGTSGKTHSNLFKSARSLHYHGVAESDASSWLWSKYQDLYPNKSHQVELAISKSYGSPLNIVTSRDGERLTIKTRTSDKDKITHETILKNIDKVIGYNIQIPKDITSIDYLPDDILRPLYGQKALICIAKSVYDFSTKTLEEHQNSVNNAQFVVANPMCKRLGKTQDGTVSARCKDNACTKPKVLVFECDIIPSFRKQAKIIFFLAQIFPLVVAHSSGNKSLHAWFKAPTTTKEIARAKELFVALGADPAALRESQLVRMPNAYRDNGERQRMIFYASHHINEKVDYDLFSESYDEFVSQKGESNNV